jgi:hypothetical protein
VVISIRRLRLIDVMQASPHVVRCVGIGAVMSAAFLIFASAVIDRDNDTLQKTPVLCVISSQKTWITNIMISKPR